MDAVHGAQRDAAERLRASVRAGAVTPAEFRSALASVPATERDAWANVVLGLETGPDEDGPDLLRGCVLYLPAPVDTIVRAAELASVQATDVFVDIGSGAGRAMALMHLLTGASAIGIEIQAGLVEKSRALARSLDRVRVVHGDAVALTRSMTMGTVFFLYAPFSGMRLDSVLDDLATLAKTREIRVCVVDLPLAPRPWLVPVATGEVDVYCSARS